MKNFRFLTLLFAMLSLFAVSCDNEPIDPSLNNGENPEVPGNELGTFSVDFNGQTYSTTTTVAVISEDGIELAATRSNGESFGFLIDGNTVGTYSAESIFLAYQRSSTEEFGFSNIHSDLEDSNGTVTITSINTQNNTISGTFSFTGYWTDLLDEDSPEPIIFTNGTFTNIPFTGNVPGGGSGGNNGSAGDYWPTAIGNQWTFSMNGTIQDPMEMVSTSTFNGQTYYKFSTLFGGPTGGFNSADVWINNNNGVYTMKMGEIDLSGGGMSGSQSGYEMIMLKDNLAVNQTWTGQYSQTTTYTGMPGIVQTTNYTGKILARDASESINGVAYSNIIKAQIRQETSIMGAVTVTTSEYWFAKDIGPVKTISTIGTTSFENILVDYEVN